MMLSPPNGGQERREKAGYFRVKIIYKIFFLEY